MSSIELTENARGGGKTERDAVSRCRCAAQMSKSPDVGPTTRTCGGTMADVIARQWMSPRDEQSVVRGEPS
jgi:hypothetical protein